VGVRVGVPVVVDVGDSEFEPLDIACVRSRRCVTRTRERLRTRGDEDVLPVGELRVDANVVAVDRLEVGVLVEEVVGLAPPVHAAVADHHDGLEARDADRADTHWPT
jgi:hypothetical protein